MEEKKGVLLSFEEKEKLTNLLRYANEAIEYWFDGCDANEHDVNENIEKIKDCEYFLQKLIKEE
ncbi:hypothetical protein [Bacillus toyonensis]|uniref:hypothetical protein n=1 Tax=Bacillus toyonensis TaxID=155322 RepID=UPI002406AA62|nr:hypothetical protein [Bacillus toyonensis]MDF9450321.1 hypothetical protein [Bacillus toyonensis]MDG1561555.1 hypothetical protein [Bacillus toyonensis]